MTVLFWILIGVGCVFGIYALLCVKPAWKAFNSEKIVDDLAEAMPVYALFWSGVFALVCFAGAGLISYFYF